MAGPINAGNDWLVATELQKESLALLNYTALLSGFKWASNALTWSAPSSDYGNIFNTVPGEAPKFTPFSVADIQLTQSLMDYLSSIINIDFTFTTASSSNIKFGFENSTVGGYAAYPPDGRIYIDDDVVGKLETPNGRGFITIIHELGHALGLKHPFDNSPNLSDNLNFELSTAMSYDGFQLTSPSFVGYSIQSYMPIDIQALLSLYGASHRTSDAEFTFSFSSTAMFAYSAQGAVVNINSPFYLYDANHKVTLNFAPLADQTQHLVVDLVRGEVWFGGQRGLPYYTYKASTATFSDLQYAPSTSTIYNAYIDSHVNVARVIGTQFDDDLRGDGRDNSFAGGGGNDVFRGNGGNDNLDGGAGLNTAAFNGGLSHFQVSVSGAQVTVLDKTGADGLDTLNNIQSLAFSDATLETSWFQKAASAAPAQFAQLLEMYIAYFDRAPDALGLDYWASRMVDGMSLQEIARSFFVQPEAQAAYPATQTNPEFMSKIYNNVLNRDVDQAGLDYWLADLSAGRIAKTDFLLAILNGAKSSTGSAADAQLLVNKKTVGTYYAVTQGLNDATHATTVMSSVDGTAASVSHANLLTDAFALSAQQGNTSEFVVQLVGVSL